MKRLAILVLCLLPAPSLAQSKPPSSTFNNLRAWNFDISGVSPLDTSLSTRGGVPPLSYHNPNVIRMGSGNQVSICPAGSCLDGVSDGSPSNDHHRTSALFSARTMDDAHSQENTVSVITTMDKGFAPNWSASTAYGPGANVRRGAEIYRAAGACTSGATGPSGLALSGIADGSCQWGWINAGAINAKVGLYVETDVIPGAGPSWGAAFNYHFKNDPTIPGNFWPGVEFDYANDSGKDCTIGVADCTSIRVGIAGNGSITHGMQITGDGFVRDGQQRKSMIWGIRLNGDNAVSGAGIELDLQSEIGLGLGASGIGTTTFSDSAIKDVSTNTPVGLRIQGQKTVASIQDTATAPASIQTGGTKSIADLVLGSTTTNGISLGGTYSGAQIVGNGWNVSPAGTGTFSNLLVSGIIYEPGPFVPASSVDTCVKGQRAWDASYEYRCVATNTWKRSALSSW